jgi:hypothetical protein
MQPLFLSGGRPAPFSRSSKMMTPSARCGTFILIRQDRGLNASAQTEWISLFTHQSFRPRTSWAAFFNTRPAEPRVLSLSASAFLFAVNLMRWRRLLLLKNENCLPLAAGWMFMPSRNRVCLLTKPFGFFVLQF